MGVGVAWRGVAVGGFGVAEPMCGRASSQSGERRGQARRGEAARPSWPPAACLRRQRTDATPPNSTPPSSTTASSNSRSLHHTRPLLLILSFCVVLCWALFFLLQSPSPARPHPPPWANPASPKSTAAARLTPSGSQWPPVLARQVYSLLVHHPQPPNPLHVSDPTWPHTKNGSCLHTTSTLLGLLHALLGCLLTRHPVTTTHDNNHSPHMTASPCLSI